MENTTHQKTKNLKKTPGWNTNIISQERCSRFPSNNHGAAALVVLETSIKMTKKWRKFGSCWRYTPENLHFEAQKIDGW